MADGMEFRPDDAVYVIAVRARGDDGGRSLREVLGKIGAEITGEGDGFEYTAHVVAHKLEDAYRVEDGPRTAQNQNDTLRILGFDFDAANDVVPVAWEHAT